MGAWRCYTKLHQVYLSEFIKVLHFSAVLHQTAQSNTGNDTVKGWAILLLQIISVLAFEC